MVTDKNRLELEGGTECEFAAEEPDNPGNHHQIAQFEELRGYFDRTVEASLANSSGIFLASRPFYDLVRPEDRGTAAGLMNTVGWSGAFVAGPWIGKASDQVGLGVAITATAAVYLLVGLLAFFAAWLASVRASSN